MCSVDENRTFGALWVNKLCIDVTDEMELEGNIWCQDSFDSSPKTVSNLRKLCVSASHLSSKSSSSHEV
jgi:hypothetical protein